MQKDPRPGSLFLRNAIFTILQPGVVAGLIPYLIAGDNVHHKTSFGLSGIDYLALAMFFTGIVITLHCIFRFAVEGKGTLSPADPTRKLVVSGLYKFSRNPMYVGVSLMLAGESIFLGSTSLWIYTAIVISAFNLFVIFYEEPRLKKAFGSEYEGYRKLVRRWL